jgi:hypothetical protein
VGLTLELAPRDPGQDAGQEPEPADGTGSGRGV